MCLGVLGFFRVYGSQGSLRVEGSWGSGFVGFGVLRVLRFGERRLRPKYWSSIVCRVVGCGSRVGCFL